MRWPRGHPRPRGATVPSPRCPATGTPSASASTTSRSSSIPGERVLRDEDLVSVDCGAILQGWHGDAAISVHVGGPEAATEDDRALSEATRAALWAGIAAFRIGSVLGDVGAAIEDEVTAQGRRLDRPFGIVEGYTGHAIGREMHEEPEHSTTTGSRAAALSVRATVAIRPMITAGLRELGSSPTD